MTSYSRSDLATRILRDLGTVGAEETPSAADRAFAEETIVSETALLAAKGIRIWNGSDQSLPPEYLTAFSRRIGLALAPSFGLTDIATAQLAMPQAESDLIILSAVPATGAIAQSDPF